MVVPLVCFVEIIEIFEQDIWQPQISDRKRKARFSSNGTGICDKYLKLNEFEEEIKEKKDFELS